MPTHDLERDKLRKSIRKLFGGDAEHQPLDTSEQRHATRDQIRQFLGGEVSPDREAKHEQRIQESDALRKRLRGIDEVPKLSPEDRERMDIQKLANTLREPALTDVQRQKMGEKSQIVEKDIELAKQPLPITETLQKRVEKQGRSSIEFPEISDEMAQALLPAITSGVGFLFGGFEGGAAGAEAGMTGLKMERERQLSLDKEKRDAFYKDAKLLLGAERINMLREAMGLKSSKQLIDLLLQGDERVLAEKFKEREFGLKEKQKEREFGLKEKQKEREFGLKEKQVEADVSLKQAKAAAARAQAKRITTAPVGKAPKMLKIAGWEQNPDASPPTKDDVKKFKKSLESYKNISAGMKVYRKLYQQYGTEVLPTEGKDQMLKMRREIQLQLKELAGLGVLNGPDLLLMNEIMPDPTSFKEKILGGLGSDRINKAFQQFDKTLRTKLDNSADVRGFVDPKIMNFARKNGVSYQKAREVLIKRGYR